MEESKSIIKSAFRQLLGAIIRLAIRNGLNFIEFSNMAKLLYVEIATNEFGIKGRKTNISRVSLMTGLDRKEIKAIRDQAGSHVGVVEKRPDKMANILTNWFGSSEYVNKDGSPRILPFESDEGPCFSRLVQECAGSAVAPVTVLREFKHSKVVEETEDGGLKVLKSYFIPNYHQNSEITPGLVNPDAITHGSSMLVDHVNTIFHNLYREDMNESAQLDMRSTNTLVKASKKKEFYALVDKLGMHALNEIHLWMEKNEVDKDRDSVPYVRLGLGVYSIEGENQTVNKESKF